MEKVVYSKRVACQLKLRGFKEKRVDINKYHPEYLCWVFEKTPKLMVAFDQIMKNN